MSLVGFPAKNHPQQETRDDVDDRGTPDELFLALSLAHGPFTVDAAAAAHNAKCARYFDKTTNGLIQDWGGENVFCNPPFSSLDPWVRKAHTSLTARICMILPANRTEQPWWQDWIEPYRDNGGRLSTRFIPKRQRFLMPGDKTVQPNNRPPFGIVVCTWRRQ